ncbi:MAG: aminomethyl transferase family protein [Planctomycetes bacterium]|nr:aminomethyl transferase family protein [Planctomycetota bacterium]
MERSALLHEHQTAGARLQPGEPARLLTYGDVPAEYHAAQEGCALFDETDRGRLEVSGPEAAAFLHRLLANEVRGLAVGSGARNLLLDAKGKILFEFELYRVEDARFVLSVPPGRAAALAAALERYHFSEKIAFENQSASYAPLVVLGPQSDALVERVLACAAPQAEYSWTSGSFEGAPVLAVRTRSAGSRAIRLVAAPEFVARLWNALRAAGATAAGVIVRDILRVEAGAALPGEDVDETVYPQEARWEDAFSLEKGCYIGQEVVAKIDTYGGLNKRLTLLKVSHDDPIARGTRLYRLDEGEWRDLGVVTSWAYSFVLDTGAVLAYVKRRHQKAGTQFRVGEGPATAVIVRHPLRANALAASGEFE